MESMSINKINHVFPHPLEILKMDGFCTLWSELWVAQPTLLSLNYFGLLLGQSPGVKYWPKENKKALHIHTSAPAGSAGRPEKD